MNTNVESYEIIARFYDPENADLTDDLALYSELASEIGGPVLDMGCGTGRVMFHLAQEGYRTVGVDLSEAMLRRGRRKLDALANLKPLVTFVYGDALTADLPGPFNLIIVPYNTFMHFGGQPNQIAALRHARDLLAEDGQLVLDLPNAGEMFGTQDTGAVVLERSFIEPESGHLVMQQSVSTVDRAAQYLHITWIYDEIGENGVVQRTTVPQALRCVLLGEMDLMLAAVGLSRVEVYGDYNRSPFEDGCPRMIVLAHRADRRE